VDQAGAVEGGSAGTDALPPVLPTSENLAGVFAPTSDSPWLTITSTNSGVVSFAFTATTNNRTGHITVLGVSVPITQQGIVTSLSTTNLVEGPASGADSVALTVAGAWTATTMTPGCTSAPAARAARAAPRWRSRSMPTLARRARHADHRRIDVDRDPSRRDLCGRARRRQHLCGPHRQSRGGAAGSDALPPVVPATANLTGAYAPTSDSTWLTVTGITNGVVSFSFSVAATNRTGHIVLLGLSVPVTQPALITSLSATNLVAGPAEVSTVCT